MEDVSTWRHRQETMDRYTGEVAMSDRGFPEGSTLAYEPLTKEPPKQIVLTTRVKDKLQDGTEVLLLSITRVMFDTWPNGNKSEPVRVKAQHSKVSINGQEYKINVLDSRRVALTEVVTV